MPAAAAVPWQAEPVPPPAAAPAGRGSREALHETLYGGLVGDMIGGIEQRMQGPAAETLPPEPADVFHGLSVAAGYLALAGGCALTAAGIAAVL